MQAYIRCALRIFAVTLIGISACLIDTCSFGVCGYPYIQSLMCCYLLSLAGGNTAIIFVLLLLLAIESVIFFSNAFILSALGVILMLPAYVLRQWLHLRTLVPFVVLSIALVMPLIIWGARGIYLLQVWWLVGYFICNMILLSVINLCFSGILSGNRK